MGDIFKKIENDSKKDKEKSLMNSRETDFDTNIGPEQGSEPPSEKKIGQSEIEKTGSIKVASDGFTVHCISIIGQIEGHYLLPSTQKTTKYEHILPMLVEIEEDDGIDGLLVILNTVGGDVEAGLAISEMIASMKKPSVSLVLGGGHSIGIPLAVSAKRSFIVPSATMTLHPVRYNGVVIGAPQTYYYLDKIQDRIFRFISQNSKISEERLRELSIVNDEMVADIGSILDGNRAVEEGLIDSVGGLSSALGALRALTKEKRKKIKEVSKKGKDRD